MPVLQFKGKTAVENYHHVVPHHTLEFDEALSVLQPGENPSLDGNLIIEGDNLLALKALLPTHAGRVKCIYIDPPYNTGNEGWVYNDNLTQPQFKEWIGQTVGKEGEDATRHDKWCCMMYPRLQLLKELLREDGAIFVSIDDNEVHHLRMMMEDVFGEENFVATIIWRNSTGPKQSNQLSTSHDYILCFAKNKSQWKRNLLPRTPEQEADYTNPDDDPRGPWRSGGLDARMLLKLASTNRESKEQLKFFRDSGGNIVQHFPPENAPGEHRALKEKYPNLDMLVDDASSGEHLVKTSLGNLVRLYEPPVILDEGHKATSDLARKTIEGFNASIVVELSATPHKEANILVRVKGRELLEEQMIKLPINIANSNQQAWQDCLTKARDKREELARHAAEHYRQSDKLIRPIVLVQVERTGKDQRDTEFVHSEDVKEHLILKLGVPEAAIAIKTSEKDDIEGIDLLAEGCPIEWIITKAALQEGWDCPFAYVLVSLNNTGSQQSMTQLVGRVLRQPFTEKTPFDELNQSYVFCLRRKASDITREVKKALEQEGYEGDAISVVDRSEEGGKPSEKLATQMRESFRSYYREFNGKVYLPLFTVKIGKDYELLDYYRHLLSKVDVNEFNYNAADWDMTEPLRRAKDSFFKLTLEQDLLEPIAEQETAVLETDEQVLSWLVAGLPFEYFSFKQMRIVVNRVRDCLYQANRELVGKLSLVKFVVREKLIGLINAETDRQTHAAFEALFKTKKLHFALECREGRFEIPSEVEVKAARRLVHNNGEQIQQSLFDIVPDAFNDYEKAVALYLDKHPKVLWWYRNMIGQFYVQGYKRNRIFPDFVVQESDTEKKPVASVLVLESKGKHLKRNEDTLYKRSIAEYFKQVGHKVPWQKLAEDFPDNRFRVYVLDEGEYQHDDWRDELKRILDEPLAL